MNVTIEAKELGKNKPEWNLDADLEGEVSLQQLLFLLKDTLIEVSQTALSEEQRRGFDKNPVTRVDNKVGKSIFNVNPLGKIEYIARQSARQIILDIFNNLIKRSPIDTGEYVKSHIVAYNGRVVANDLPSLISWLDGLEGFSDRDKIRFINTAPYARKLERDGVTSQRTKVKVGIGSKRKSAFQNTVKIPNGAYALTARAIRAKYKGTSGIKLDILPGNYIGIDRNYPRVTVPGKKNMSSRREFKGDGRPYLYPTILLTISELGILDVASGDFG
jgi:hypothetical protein